jgi:hypothetical protein
MTRSARLVAVVALAFGTSAANAQFPVAPGPPIYGGFGPYAGYAPYAAFGPYGGAAYGYGGLGPYGFGGVGGMAGYGPLLYSQQLFQQQALASQQIFQQQQQAIVGQIQAAQGRLKVLDDKKQQLLKQYQAMSDSEKATVRAGLLKEYLTLNAHRQEGWKRDEAIRTILGSDLERLDSLAALEGLTEPERNEFLRSLRAQYRSLSPAEQTAWQKDEVLRSLLGNAWWLK